MKKSNENKDKLRNIAEVFKDIFVLIVLLLVFFFRGLRMSTKTSKKKVLRILRRKYPDYEIDELIMTYADWSSTIKAADEDDKDIKASGAEAVIRNNIEQRTLHFSKTFGIWRITNDVPDTGPNVPEGAYFVTKSYGAVGPAIDIDEYIKGCWIIPDKNGDAYHKVGSDDIWHYSIHYVSSIYKVENGKVYELNKDTFIWELTERTYSEMDYYGNYDPITKEEAEEIIRTYKKEEEKILV